MSEFHHEPIPGLPALLPAGETILWQGSPSWQGIALRALHANWAMAYIAAGTVWAVVNAVQNSSGFTGATAAGGRVLIAGFAGIGLLIILARLIARTTIYTITSRRVVMRIGVAIPITINLPMRLIGSADLLVHRDGSGDIALATNGSTRLGYVPLWPHVRAWHLKNPQPVLRALPGAKAVAALLSEALTEVNGTAPMAAANDARTKTSSAGHANGRPAAAVA